MTNMEKNNDNRKEFELCGETFAVEDFPRLYQMVQTSPANAAAQLQSIANAWHDGDIVSAAQSFESDMG